MLPLPGSLFLNIVVVFWNVLGQALEHRHMSEFAEKFSQMKARFPFLAKTGFETRQTVRDRHQNRENKVFQFWTLFWTPFRYPSGVLFGAFLESILDPVGTLGAPSRSLWSLLGSGREPGG